MEERKQQEDYFQEPNVNLMVATDAAGEGLNLQFCHIMVNYELPWNPNRIEQRIGRLHRYGQHRDVRVYNLQVVNTREGLILARLLNKIQTIEKQLGGYAPNILGITALAGAANLNRLSDLIMNAIAEDTPPEVTAEYIEQAVEARRQMYEQLESSLFMPLRHFDKGPVDKLIQRSRELTPSNSDIEAFIRCYFEIHNGKIENTRQKKVVRLKTPRNIIDGKKTLDEYPHCTFDKETAFKHKTKEVQFIAFGHPLLEAIIHDCCRRTPKLRGALSVKRLPSETQNISSSVLFNYVLRYSDSQDNTLMEELLPIIVTLDGKVDLENARSLLCIGSESLVNPQDNPQLVELVTKLEEMEILARQAAAEIAQNNFKRVQGERNRQAEACLKSLEQFQQAKAKRLRSMITDYQLRLFGGEEMDIAIRRSQYELDRLNEECERRRQQVETRRYVQANAPTLLNLALLLI